MKVEGIAYFPDDVMDTYNRLKENNPELTITEASQITKDAYMCAYQEKYLVAKLEREHG